MRTLINLIVVCMAVSSCTYYICDCKKEPEKGKLVFDKRMVYPEYSTLELRHDILTRPSFMPIPTEVDTQGVLLGSSRIGIFHPDSGRMIRFIVKPAPFGFNHPAPEHKLNIIGHKQTDTLK